MPSRLDSVQVEGVWAQSDLGENDYISGRVNSFPLDQFLSARRSFLGVDGGDCPAMAVYASEMNVAMEDFTFTDILRGRWDPAPPVIEAKYARSSKKRHYMPQVLRWMLPNGHVCEVRYLGTGMSRIVYAVDEHWDLKFEYWIEEGENPANNLLELNLSGRFVDLPQTARSMDPRTNVQERASTSLEAALKDPSANRLLLASEVFSSLKALGIKLGQGDGLGAYRMGDISNNNVGFFPKRRRWLPLDFGNFRFRYNVLSPDVVTEISGIILDNTSGTETLDCLTIAAYG